MHRQIRRMVAESRIHSGGEGSVTQVEKAPEAASGISALRSLPAEEDAPVRMLGCQ